LNLHKSENSVPFERSLAHVLKNWAARQSPPLGARARLLRTAEDQARQRANGVMNFSLWSDRDQRPIELRSLFYAPHFSSMGAWINF
jgi:hypothetical protein